MHTISASRALAAPLLVGALSACLATAANATLSISKKATKSVTCSSGVCTASAKNATLNATDLATMLATADVTVVPGKKAADIDVAAPGRVGEHPSAHARFLSGDQLRAANGGAGHGGADAHHQ